MSPCRVDKGQTDLYNGITYGMGTINSCQ